MLLANMAVAHKIHNAFPDLAVLRRHPAPQSKMIADLQQVCGLAGLDVDVTSSQAIQVRSTIHGSVLLFAGLKEKF